MSERMTPIPFAKLIGWLSTEHKKSGSAFGVSSPYQLKDTKKVLPLFGEHIEMPFGPAAGPNTQLAQNIIAAYFAGARFFELKTVQKMDGAELAACIGRPCILAEDEGYNCEWSTELTVPQAFEEYVKAWITLKLISKRWHLGRPDGFMFNMSVGYDLAGIKTEKLNTFIDGMVDASSSAIWNECIQSAAALFPEDADYIRSICPNICTGVTVSTLHGCPPQEIEAIASYLIAEKHLNTFVKCNPTILGYEFARKTLDAMGYDYISFDEHHFNEDLQYDDAIPMFRRLSALARANGLEFGLKLSNTFPVDVAAHELPSTEMYMSGKALYPLTIEMAARISMEFSGALRLSYSGGADYFNIKKLFEAGIWPITVATTILKPGGYNRFVQLAELFEITAYRSFSGVDSAAVAALSADARTDCHHLKAVKPLPRRKLWSKVPLIDCFTAPCMGGCPIEQDIPEYIRLCGNGEYEKALRLITEKNPLPFITGTICAHHCMDKCTRNFYESPVNIRDTKLIAAERGYSALISSISAPSAKPAPKTAIIGGGPAGLAAAYFLARAGYPVTVFEKQARLGGIVRSVIPEFRISHAAIDKDVALVERMGAKFVLGNEAPNLEELRAQGYIYTLLAIGAGARGHLDIPGNVMNVIDFLYAAKNEPDSLRLGKNIAIIGGGNTAMDAARTAKRIKGVDRVSLVYRRTKKYMPADAEELELAMHDGVELCELLSPVSHENGILLCKRMALGEPDASGRRSPVETDETVRIPANIVIAAVGEKPDAQVFAKYGITLDEKGRAKQRYGNVFVAGDALRGPATVVEAIADSSAFAEAIIGEIHAYAIPAQAQADYSAALAKKGALNSPCKCEADRCLSCNTVCECCVSVCPNRANIAIAVPGKKMRQILHIDYMCNECGNCMSFCPYDSAPYKDKFTYFANERDFNDSTNNGFMLLDRTVPIVKVRLGGETAEYNLAQSNSLDKDIECIILTVLNDYPYVI
ncbi:MAG: putative selenate reductase subunit YgfK [Clostridia bacterium]